MQGLSRLLARPCITGVQGAVRAFSEGPNGPSLVDLKKSIDATREELHSLRATTSDRWAEFLKEHHDSHVKELKAFAEERDKERAERDKKWMELRETWMDFQVKAAERDAEREKTREKRLSDFQAERDKRWSDYQAEHAKEWHKVHRVTGGLVAAGLCFTGLVQLFVHRDKWFPSNQRGNPNAGEANNSSRSFEARNVVVAPEAVVNGGVGVLQR